MDYGTLVQSYPQYQGWGQNEAMADAQAKGLLSNTNGGAYDYASAAKAAYGEIGPYYHNLLVQYQGNMNKVLARLQQDYETGARNHAADTATALTNANTNVMDNSLARGIYQKSAYNPQAGYGLPAANLAKAQEPINTAQQRYTDQANTNLARGKEDQADAYTKYQADLEQQQRTESANLANSRGAQYNQLQAAKDNSLYNPSLV